jgi:predicted DNA-binding antitoxin AbrB/MazE fold protein
MAWPQFDRAAVPFRRYNERMSMHVEAVYEHGMLKPLQALDLAENEHVSLLVTPTAHISGACQADVEFTESLRCKLQDAGPAPGLEEVRRRLSKIPGTLTADFIAERVDR